MELKDPHARVFVFSAFLILEIVILVLILRKNIDYTSFDAWISSLLLPTVLFTISFSKELWKAYREIKKTGDENS
ncbi:hypothetical protein [Dyadobacter sp. 3J3]|uniref:hypothetical protein n=1 Tax=Dyadobacter sp. 3J3 TaxID=2606600 RepID=UPI0013586ACB|nr:hypothetical protein [Dyadobacter sp. 3J3]